MSVHVKIEVTQRLGGDRLAVYMPSIWPELQRLAEQLASVLTQTRPDRPLVTYEGPRRLPQLSGELALWRSFLGEEIEAILHDED